MKDKLIKLIDKLETRQLANIFKAHMEENNIRKFDDRKKENSNTYFVYGKDEGWDRVYCIYYNDKDINDIEIVFRKRAGLYLIIKRGARVIFDHSFNGTSFNTYYDEILFNKLYEEYKDFFEELFKVI